MNQERTATLIVPAQAPPPDGGQQKPEDFEEQAIPVIGRIFHKSEEIPTGKLEDGLDKVQEQVGDLLGRVKASTVAGFRLSSVEVGLAISAEGSVGFATAGVQASISLSFEHVAS